MSILISKISDCLTVRANAMLKQVTGIPLTRERTAAQALQNFNQYTLGLYAQQKAKVKNQLGQTIPVMLANQDHLSSRYRGIREGVTYIPPEYHVLKALAHTPIAVHTVLGLQDSQELNRLCEKLEGLFRPYQERSNAASTL